MATERAEYAGGMRQLAEQSSQMTKDAAALGQYAAKVDEFAASRPKLDQLAKHTAEANVLAKQLIPPKKPQERDLKVAAILVGQAFTLLAVPLSAIALILVLLDSASTGGRPLRGWACVFVLFGALVLLGIAALMYVKIQPAIMSILGFG